MLRIFVVAALAVAVQLTAVVQAGESRNVAVVVNNALYAGGGITASIDRYLQDIRLQGYNPTLVTSSFADANALRGYLYNTYSTTGLAGAVLVGDVPYARFETAADGWFPQDLYLQDLNGTWTDSNGNGSFDTHSGNVAPEIWLGRLRVDDIPSLRQPGKTEADLFNHYFSKNHAYRMGQLSTSRNGMAFIDDDWASYLYGQQWAYALDYAVETATYVSNTTATNAAAYKAAIEYGYEQMLVAVHSTANYHRFQVGNNWEYVYSADLAGLDDQVLFYNLFACKSAKLNDTNCMAEEYIFGTGMGLIAVGTSQEGGMLNYFFYYDALRQGGTFGEAMQAWWTNELYGGPTAQDYDWSYGQMLLGDPLLMTQQYVGLLVPEPGTLALLVVGAVGGLIVRRRRVNTAVG